MSDKVAILTYAYKVKKEDIDRFLATMLSLNYECDDVDIYIADANNTPAVSDYLYDLFVDEPIIKKIVFADGVNGTPVQIKAHIANLLVNTLVERSETYDWVFWVDGMLEPGLDFINRLTTENEITAPLVLTKHMVAQGKDDRFYDTFSFEKEDGSRFEFYGDFKSWLELKEDIPCNSVGTLVCFPGSFIYDNPVLFSDPDLTKSLCLEAKELGYDVTCKVDEVIWIRP